MKTKVLTFFLLFLSTFAFSQANKVIEDLTNQLQNYAKEDTNKALLFLKLSAANYGINPKVMQKAAEDAILISEKTNFKRGAAEGYKLLGAKCFSTGDYAQANNNYRISLKLYQEIEFPRGLILCYNNLGTVALVQGNYPEALQYFQNSVRIGEKSNQMGLAGLAFSNMGIIYSEQKKFDLALKRFQDALQIHITAKNNDGIAGTLGNLGNVYFNMKDTEKAVEYFTKSIEKYTEINNKMGIAGQYGSLASVFAEQKAFEKSYESYSKALKLNEELGNKKGMAFNYKGIGEYYLKQNNIHDAQIAMDKAKLLTTQLGLKDLQKEVFFNMSEIYEKQGKTDSAYVYFKKYFDVKESIDNENNRKQITRLEIQYEFDTKEEKYKTQQILDAENLKQQQLMLALNNTKLIVSNKERDLVKLNFLKTQADLKTEQVESVSRKKQLEAAENEVKLRKNEIEIANLNIAAQEKQKWYFIVGLLLLGVIGALLFYQRNSSQKANRKLQTLNTELDEANQAKVRFLGILNHDLRSPVANLLHFLQLQKDSPELLDDVTIKRLQGKTTAGVENLLASMEDILLWSKGQMQNFKPQLKKIAVSSLFEDTKKHFESEEKVKVVFQNPENIHLNSDEDYLKTIIRNLTGNAIKVMAKTENPTIVWNAWQVNGKQFLSISDNGQGAEKEQFKALYDDTEVVGIKTGLGLHLIRDLAKAIDCDVSVDSKIGFGTVFTLTFH